MARILIVDDQKSPIVVASMLFPLNNLQGDAKSEQIAAGLDFKEDVDVWAQTVDKGLEAIHDGHWNIMCLDHDMGTKNGTVITQFLSQNPDHLPDEVYFISMNPVGKQRMINDLLHFYSLREEIRGEFGNVTKLYARNNA